ncbi:Exportin-2 [Thelohanellus kitauei]|uniref:Exportin-2 n=1 Tax=Thelohanellus kitauei TaxID=669202 RepID=A0A0C2ME28_THEKT|nr:Exportin-2 [Thelohanellus kitauei]
MFVRKYTSDFDGYARTYMETVWVLTASHLKSDQSDKLTSECLHFIKMAITTSSIRSLFEQDDNGLSGLFVNIIIPNLVPGPYDEELFEDDPIEYVRSEMDGDAESRRQAAADLVSSLAFAYEKKIIPMILQFIEQLVQKSRDSDDWKYEDAAIRLIMAVTNKFGAIKFGVAEVSPLLDVNKIYTQLIYPIFSDPKRNPMLLGSALKYTIIFRKVMNSQMVDATIACYISLMSHANFGVRYFSCIVVSELILPPNHPDANTRLLIIVEHLQTIYSHLMNLIIGQTALSDVPFQCLISLLLKTHSFSKQYIGTIMDNLLSVVVKLGSINSNPASIHSLFSSICLCFRFSFLYTNEMFNVQASKFITLANGLIMKNSCDLADYLLQTLSVIVSHFCPFELVEIKACFTRLIEVPSWEGDPSHFCSTSLLAGAFMESAPDLILGQGYYTFFIDIFERYSRNVRYDSVVFNILKPIVFLPWKRAKISFPTRVFDIVFSRLTKLKKPKFISGFVDFIYLFVMAFNSDELVKLVEGIQRLIIFRIVRGLLLPELANPISIVRKKCISIVCCQILFSISIHVAYDAKDWANDLLKLFDSNPPTQPLIRPDLIEYYKSLGNFETDLLPSFEPVPEDTMNVIRFVVPKFDHHPHVCDVKAFIKEMYETMKTGLKQEATLIIESKLKT